MKSLIKITSVLFLLLAIVGLGTKVAWGWQDPPASPPACDPNTFEGCNPPINAGENAQTKLGALTVGGLRSILNVVVDGLLRIGTTDTTFTYGTQTAKPKVAIVNTAVSSDPNFYDQGLLVKNAGNGWAIQAENSGGYGIRTVGNTYALQVNGPARLMIPGYETAQGKTLRAKDNSGLLEWATGGAGGDSLWGGTLTGNVWNLNTGNVGVGTQSPSGKLTVKAIGNSTNGIVLEKSSATTPIVALGQGSGSQGFLSLYNNTSQSILLNANNSSFILSGLGIGNSSPQALFHVGDSASLVSGQVPKALIKNTDTSHAYDQGLYVENASTNGWAISGVGPMGIRASGNGSAASIAFQADSGKARFRTTNYSRGANQVFVSEDSQGSGVWKWPNEIPGMGGGSLPSGSPNQTLRHNGTDWVADSTIINTGTNVGIGTSTGLVHKLTVKGNTLLDGVLGVLGKAAIGSLQVTGGTPEYGKVLMSLDASGNAQWTATSSLGLGLPSCPQGQVAVSTGLGTWKCNDAQQIDALRMKEDISAGRVDYIDDSKPCLSSELGQMIYAKRNSGSGNAGTNAYVCAKDASGNLVWKAMSGYVKGSFYGMAKTQVETSGKRCLLNTGYPIENCTVGTLISYVTCATGFSKQKMGEYPSAPYSPVEVFTCVKN